MVLKPCGGAIFVEPMCARKHDDLIADCDIIHAHTALCFQIGP